MQRLKFSQSTKDHLGGYVYALVDPRDDVIFYVGKADSNDRAFSHFVAKKGEGKKQARISEIISAGLKPQVDILRYGLSSERECFDVEAAVIDTIGLENLTNLVRGHGTDRGRQTWQFIETLYGSPPLDVGTISDRYMLLFVGKTYTPTLEENKVYDSVRKSWSGVAAAKRTPNGNGEFDYSIALGIVDSVVIRAYSIAAWFPANTTYASQTSEDPENRWEFVGQLLANHKLVGMRLTSGGTNLKANRGGYGYIN